jgi:hypothetical protein
MCVLGVLILEVDKPEKARHDYGSYASEILEGQQTTQEDAQIHLNETFHVDRHNLNNNESPENI